MKNINENTLKIEKLNVFWFTYLILPITIELLAFKMTNLNFFTGVEEFLHLPPKHRVFRQLHDIEIILLFIPSKNMIKRKAEWELAIEKKRITDLHKDKMPKGLSYLSPRFSSA